MQAAVEQLAGVASLALRSAAILVILYGAGEAVFDIVSVTSDAAQSHAGDLALLRAVAADWSRVRAGRGYRSHDGPDVDGLGQLAVIAGIRPFAKRGTDRRGQPGAGYHCSIIFP